MIVGSRISRVPVEALDPVVQLLVRARHEAGLTQREVADKAGLSKGMVGNIEIGIAVGTLATLAALAGVYGWHVALVDSRGREVRL